MPQLSFAGPTYVARSAGINLERSVNFYVETNPAGSKGQASLVGTPGTALFSNLGLGVVRGQHVFNGLMFVVAGSTLYSLTSTGVATSIGALATSSGRVSMHNNGLTVAGVGGNQLIIVDGTSGYVHNVFTGAFGVIASAGFPANPSMVAYLDGYFVVFGSGRMAFAVSNLYDGTVWNALATGSIIASPDPIQGVLASHQQLWFVKADTTEVWYNAGIPTSQGSPFARMPGAILDIGTFAPWSIAQGDSGIYLLGNLKANNAGGLAGIVRIDGYTPQVISPPAINYQIQQLSTISDAFGYCYVDEGHSFYVLTFPTGNATYVYDATTNLFHERSLYTAGNPHAVCRHVGNSYIYFNNKHYIGDYRNGKVYQMSSAYYDDAGEPLVSFRTTQYAQDPDRLKNVFFQSLQLDMETGVANAAVAEPQISLAWSDDGGRSWSNEHTKSMGKVGEYTLRTKWNRLGCSRARVFRATISDAVKRVITGAYVEAGL